MCHQDLLSASLGLTCKKWPMFCLTNRTSKIVSLWWDETNLQNHGIIVKWGKWTKPTSGERSVRVHRSTPCRSGGENHGSNRDQAAHGSNPAFVSVANSEHRARPFAYGESVTDSELGWQVEHLWQRPDGLQSLNYLWSWPFQKMSADPCSRSLLPPEQNYHKNLDGNVISILLKWSMRNELYCRRCNCSWCVRVSIHYSPTHRWSIHRPNWAITIKSSYLWYFA